MEGSVLTCEQLVHNILSPSICSAANHASVLPTWTTSLGVMRVQCCWSRACNEVAPAVMGVLIFLRRNSSDPLPSAWEWGKEVETSPDKHVIAGSSPLVSAVALPPVEVTVLEVFSLSKPVCAACLSLRLAVLPAPYSHPSACKKQPVVAEYPLWNFFISSKNRDSLL